MQKTTQGHHRSAAAGGPRSVVAGREPLNAPEAAPRTPVAGLIQSGGFGSFSKGFGTAASGLLEAEIVTADGRVRTVNACTLELSMVSQGIDPEQSRQGWQPFFDWIRAVPRDFTVTDELGAGATAARHWWDVAGNDSMIQDKRAGAPAYYGYWKGDQGQVGAFLHGYDSTWLPAALLQEHPQRLVNALFTASRYKTVGLHFNKGLAGAADAAIAAALGTATNPAVIGAFALAIIADGEGLAFPGMARPATDLGAAHADAQAIDQATAQLRQVAPGAGSYVSESNYFNASWQSAFWGSHYSRLRAIKSKHDPEGLFFVHHGVGSEAWSADGFTRIA